MPTTFPVTGDPLFLLFPALLLGYYLLCWMKAGRDPKIENVTPQYEPPAGVSPGVARYILTGGSDGTTLAAALSQLAAKGVLSIQPQGIRYRVELLQQETPVQPEEAALIQVLFSQKMQAQPYAATGTSELGSSQVPQELREAVKKLPVQQLASFGLAVAAELAAEPRQQVTIDPRAGVQVKMALDAIQETFRKNLQGVYFRWNFLYVLAGMAATFLFTLGSAFFIDTGQAPPVFITFWLLMFTSIAGTVIAGARTSRPTHPTFAQRISAILLPLLFFVGPGFMIAKLAMPSAQFFVLAVLLAVVLNSAFTMLMRAPTEAGIKTMEHLAGFREFLVRVEQDRLERMNTREEKARLMNQYLPYAIALGVKEGWGDTMAAAFSNAVVER